MENILYSTENGVGYLTLNRPDKSNAMLTELKKELTPLLREIKYDESRALVITGAGKNFSAGGDLSTMGKLSAVQGRERMKFSYEWLTALMEIEKPVIAAVNGAASGAGFGLALACDIIIASSRAKFFSGAIKLGLVVDMATLHFLPRRVGMGKAKMITFTGDIISGEEARRIGLADLMADEENFAAEVKSFAEKMARGPTYAIGLTKNIINRSFESDINTVLDWEAAYQAISFLTEDHRIALKAFFEKSVPEFVGK